MAFEEGHGAEAGIVESKTIRGSHRFDGFQHYKYPQTVGNDTSMDDINFNSHNASDYAIHRMKHTSTMTKEPFVMFEFMKINESLANEKAMAEGQMISKFLDKEAANAQDEGRRNDAERYAIGEGNKKYSATFLDPLFNFFAKYTTQAERQYTGSIALYMPTDIQINDSMVYNEDTRKLGAALESWGSGTKGEFFNLTTLTDPTVLALGAAAVTHFLPFGNAAVAGVLTGAPAIVAQTEVQRHTGRIMNPNELTRYAQTALRTFTFNWTILPDNEKESDEVTKLIKFFRKSSHATRTSSTLVTVPDHVVTSFHGAKDMIQLPPCFIESVNVTYNPNNSSFFKRNNAPVEIGLAVALKEIVPIYSDDVDKGY